MEWLLERRLRALLPLVRDLVSDRAGVRERALGVLKTPPSPALHPAARITCKELDRHGLRFVTKAPGGRVAPTAWVVTVGCCHKGNLGGVADFM
jgi:hypothetical protein